MLYFIQGTEQYFIQKEIEKIYAKQKVTPENSIHLSAAETTFETLQMEVCTADLFGDIKGMIVNDVEQVDLQQFFSHTAPTVFTTMNEAMNVCIFVFAQDTVLSKTAQKELATLFKNVTRIDAKKQEEQQVIQFLKTALKEKNHALTHQDMVKITQKYKNSIELISNEIERISLEKANDMIQASDFMGETFFLEDQVFDLIGSIESKKLAISLAMLDNILLHQQNIFGLIALFLKNYKEMYQIKALQHVGFSQSQIAERLAIHPYRAKKLLESGRTITEKGFKNILHKIIDTEIALKSGKAQQPALKELLLYMFNESHA